MARQVAEDREVQRAMRERPKIERYCGVPPTVEQLRLLRDAGYTKMPRTLPEASRMINELEWGYIIDPYEFCF